jgi:hypothetical protein
LGKLAQETDGLQTNDKSVKSAYNIGQNTSISVNDLFEPGKTPGFIYDQMVSRYGSAGNLMHQIASGNWQASVDAGIAYMSELRYRYKLSGDGIIAAYNGGPAAGAFYAKGIRLPPFVWPETVAYVSLVKTHMSQIQAGMVPAKQAKGGFASVWQPVVNSLSNQRALTQSTAPQIQTPAQTQIALLAPTAAEKAAISKFEQVQSAFDANRLKSAQVVSEFPSSAFDDLAKAGVKFTAVDTNGANSIQYYVRVAPGASAGPAIAQITYVNNNLTDPSARTLALGPIAAAASRPVQQAAAAPAPAPAVITMDGNRFSIAQTGITKAVTQGDALYQGASKAMVKSGALKRNSDGTYSVTSATPDTTVLGNYFQSPEVNAAQESYNKNVSSMITTLDKLVPSISDGVSRDQLAAKIETLRSAFAPVQKMSTTQGQALLVSQMTTAYVGGTMGTELRGLQTQADVLNKAVKGVNTELASLQQKIADAQAAANKQAAPPQVNVAAKSAPDTATPQTTPQTASQGDARRSTPAPRTFMERVWAGLADSFSSAVTIVAKGIQVSPAGGVTTASAPAQQVAPSAQSSNVVNQPITINITGFGLSGTGKLYIPAGADLSKPLTLVTYLHGNGGLSLTYDAMVGQIRAAAKAGSNVVLLAPDLGNDPGNTGDFFKNLGGSQVYLDKVAQVIANQPQVTQSVVDLIKTNSNMTVVAYSGGYFAAGEMAADKTVGQKIASPHQ